MKKLKSLLLATTIIVSISSCGYQLRGSVNIEGLENIKIIAEMFCATAEINAVKQVVQY